MKPLELLDEVVASLAPPRMSRHQPTKFIISEYRVERLADIYDVTFDCMKQELERRNWLVVLTYGGS